MRRNHDQEQMCQGNQPTWSAGLWQNQVLRKSPGKPLDWVRDTSEGLDSQLPGTLAALPTRCHLVAPVAGTAEGAVQVDTPPMSTSPLRKTLVHVCVTQQRAIWNGRVLRAIPATQIARALCPGHTAWLPMGGACCLCPCSFWGL